MSGGRQAFSSGPPTDARKPPGRRCTWSGTRRQEGLGPVRGSSPRRARRRPHVQPARRPGLRCQPAAALRLPDVLHAHRADPKSRCRSPRDPRIHEVRPHAAPQRLQQPGRRDRHRDRLSSQQPYSQSDDPNGGPHGGLAAVPLPHTSYNMSYDISDKISYDISYGISYAGCSASRRSSQVSTFKRCGRGRRHPPRASPQPSTQQEQRRDGWWGWGRRGGGSGGGVRVLRVGGSLRADSWPFNRRAAPTACGDGPTRAGPPALPLARVLLLLVLPGFGRDLFGGRGGRLDGRSRGWGIAALGGLFRWARCRVRGPGCCSALG